MPDKYTAREMLTKLVAFNTISKNSNLQIIDFIEEYLSGYGITCHRVPNAEGDKSSLYAQIGPDVEGGVVLSGHTDVVPVEGQDWVTDPFELIEKDGKLFGRGSCDMKGFLSLGLSMLPEMLAADLKVPIQLAFSYDEEVGCLGAPPMIADMADRFPRAKAVIVGEPSMMQVVTGHKGIAEIETIVHGFEVHSSLIHTGVSAIMTAAKLINWHTDQLAENAENIKPIAVELGYVPPYTTLHNGVIHGGTAHNITAKECRFLTDIRTLPDENLLDWIAKYKAFAKTLEAEIQTIRPEASIEINVRATVEGLAPETDGGAEALARALTGDNADHVVSYATEGGQFQQGGYSTIVCGPGSIDQAHQPNEFIAISQLQAGEAFIRKIIEHLS